MPVILRTPFAITVSVSCIDKGSSLKRVTTGGLFINVFYLHRFQLFYLLFLNHLGLN